VFFYSVLLVLDCALTDAFFLLQAFVYVYWNYVVLITLQEQIDTVTVEGVVNVGEEDWIEIKTEEDYIQLVGRVKCEQEVSVLCCVVVICIQLHMHVCFLYIVFSYSFHTFISHLYIIRPSVSRCTCVIRSVCSLCVEIIVYCA
jgi:hypothetical protein